MPARENRLLNWSAAIFLAALIITLTACPHPAPAAAAHAAVADPLPSWNDGPTGQAILNFVRDVTTKVGPRHVAPEQRIAAFDNDGALWNEEPIVQVVFGVERIRAMARADPAEGGYGHAVSPPANARTDQGGAPRAIRSNADHRR